jgi:hypothetical protein
MIVMGFLFNFIIRIDNLNAFNFIIKSIQISPVKRLNGLNLFKQNLILDLFDLLGTLLDTRYSAKREKMLNAATPAPHSFRGALL